MRQLSTLRLSCSYAPFPQTSIRVAKPSQVQWLRLRSGSAFSTAPPSSVDASARLSNATRGTRTDRPEQVCACWNRVIAPGTWAATASPTPKSPWGASHMCSKYSAPISRRCRCAIVPPKKGPSWTVAASCRVDRAKRCGELSSRSSNTEPWTLLLLRG